MNSECTLPKHAPMFGDLMPGVVEANVPLAALSQWQIGGSASYFARPRSADEVRRLLKLCADASISVQVVGDTSNILFSDEGFPGLLLQIGRRMSRIDVEPGGRIRAQAGAWVPVFVRRTISAGLSGCGHAIGVPGTLGGLIVMNGGTQRRGIGECVENVTVVTRDGDLRQISHTDCAFSYRHSTLQGSGDVVIAAELRLAPGDQGTLRRQALSILQERNRKFPRKLPNCGSVFLSNPAMYSVIGPPGKAIEHVGLKGAIYGGAQISPIHANFIVNNGGASATDVLALIRLAQYRVEESTGYKMTCEVKYLMPEGGLVPADLVASASRGK